MMRTAVDTNILSAILADEPGADAHVETLFRALSEGTLVVCGPVYSELLAHPLASTSEIDDFLRHTSITVDYLQDHRVWLLSGQAFRSYAQRRRRARGGEPKRMLVDFIVGAHASLRADRLLTLDRSRYSRAFPKLRLQ